MYRVKTMAEFRQEICDPASPIRIHPDEKINIDRDGEPYFNIRTMKWLCGKELPEYNPDKKYIVASERYGVSGVFIAPYMVTTRPHPGKLHQRFDIGTKVHDLDYTVLVFNNHRVE